MNQILNMNDCETELLSMVISYPDLFEKTIVKENFFSNKQYSKMFSILFEEYKTKKVLVPQSLILNENFDIDLFANLAGSNIYQTNKDAKFMELEKLVIDNYKEKVINEIIKQYVQNDITYSKMFKLFEKVNNITYQQISYITADDIKNEIFSNQKNIKFRFKKLSQNLNLLQHDLLVIAGTTGAGKTAFALNLLEDLCKTYSCIYFNLEMSKGVLYKRLVSIQTKITLEELNDHENINYKNKGFIEHSAEVYEKNKIALVNNSQSIDSIKRFIANFKTDKHFIVFIDHIGLISSNAHNSYERATEIAKELRRISLDYNCTIIALSQLSREASKDDKPKLSHLRDSGEIEQSARKVLLLNRIDMGNARLQPIDIIIAKNDNGKIGQIGFKFDKYNQSFYEEKGEKNDN